ncbi:hypothetical protein AVEN_237711-1 [Araneus ventricosus]|uniref:Uncharacterized protein n=1 Tax=Araneus ventricosus TaxID=182803 RepID=A0A4Y2EQP4_ARAVE|nr:hypothetical protein AVEN_237711-1 [Araneus ventricosus]
MPRSNMFKFRFFSILQMMEFVVKCENVYLEARNCDLKILSEELGETVNDSHKLKDLKKMILASKEYDEESAKEWLNKISNERKEREEMNEEMKKSKLLNEDAKTKLLNEDTKTKLLNESERMKWNLSCKKNTP